jgi:hypothetical protein
MDRSICFIVEQGNEVGGMAITSHKNAAVSLRDNNSEKASVPALPCHKVKQIFFTTSSSRNTQKQGE